MPIEVGNIVSVTGLSSGPSMVVLSVNGPTAEVLWWDFQLQEHRIELPVAVLALSS